MAVGSAVHWHLRQTEAAAEMKSILAAAAVLLFSHNGWDVKGVIKTCP